MVRAALRPPPPHDFNTAVLSSRIHYTNSEFFQLRMKMYKKNAFLKKIFKMCSNFGVLMPGNCGYCFTVMLKLQIFTGLISILERESL